MAKIASAAFRTYKNNWDKTNKWLRQNGNKEVNECFKAMGEMLTTYNNNVNVILKAMSDEILALPDGEVSPSVHTIIAKYIMITETEQRK